MVLTRKKTTHSITIPFSKVTLGNQIAEVVMRPEKKAKLLCGKAGAPDVPANKN